jgi:hypothetical protein
VKLILNLSLIIVIALLSKANGDTEKILTMTDDLELASPIAKISSTEWIEQTKAIYAAFDKRNITIRAPADTCATHVHISPSNGNWDLDALKAVSRATIYYERCTDALIHEDHLHSYACKDSNFASVLYQTDIGATQYPDTWRSTMSIATNQHSLMTNLWHTIDECKSTQSIAELLCSHAIGSKKRLPGLTPDSQIQYTRRTEREISRSHRWNFRPLLDESKMEHVRAEGSTHVLGSIEFKQPEGSATAERAIAWRLFAAGFVQAALGWTYEGGVVKEALGWTYPCGVVVDTPTIEELRLFVQGGIVANGCDSGGVDVLFEGKLSAEPSIIEFGNDDGYEEYTVKAADLYDSDDSTGSDC